ncbi:MAG: efflux RND transporter periplasmic adaptor subunit [Planctomycetes bacterium]|nr:efflux RND transporter periplasmic adaptor subunit [Planctomycetota bacterium]
MRTVSVVLFCVLVAAGAFLLGRLAAPGPGAGAVPPASAERPAAAAPAAAPAVWTCPMHPAIRQPAAGDCPICGMDLVRDDGSGSAGGDRPRRLTLSPAERALAEVVTAPVERRFVTRRLRFPGEVQWDESRVRTVAARVPGRLERLYVDSTGIGVREGDHLVVLYSPELATAQQELLEVQRRLHGVSGRSEFLVESDRRALAAARGKLEEWGLGAEQIAAIEERGTAEDRMRIDSPTGGVVIEKAVEEGDYVKTGQRLYRIAELARLWVAIEVWEQDLSWVRYGQSVAITAEALPGEVFDGRISFLSPTVDPLRHTVTARVVVHNPDGRLKPGMFARVLIESRLATSGRVADPELAGKWISPMHPEVVADGPGQCTVCGMDLVPAEELGYVSADALASEKPLVVPATAVLPTGRRAVVYVEVPGTERPTYEGREVLLGPRAGDDWIVQEGLREGERVVVHGAFKIDSALQIRAEPSMLSLPGGPFAPGSPRLGGFRASLEPVWDAYFAAQRALAADDAALAGAQLAALRTAVDGAGGQELELRDREAWRAAAVAMRTALAGLGVASPIGDLRAAFAPLSAALIDVDERFGHSGERVHREVFCPMAFDDRGARWLQLEEAIGNPYFGASMLRCGEVRRLHPGYGGRAEVAGAESPAGAAPAVTAPAGPVVAGLDAVYGAVVDAGIELAADRRDGAVPKLRALQDAIAAIAAADAGTRSERLTERLGALRQAATDALAAPDLAATRAAYEHVSVAAIALHEEFGHAGMAPLFVIHCPMAFDDRGADWLSRDQVVRNPYFGSEMYSCGAVERALPGREAGR